jgi:predicted MFS family arabinose efflux permease
MKFEDYLLKRNRSVMYLLAVFGLVAGIGGVLIGIYDRDENIIWSSLLVLISAVIVFLYLKSTGKSKEENAKTRDMKE